MKDMPRLFTLILALALLFTGCSLDESVSVMSSTIELSSSSEARNLTPEPAEPQAPTPVPVLVDLAAISAFSGSPYVEINGNVPYFTEADSTTNSFESYAELDSLGRCGTAYACIGVDIMPTEERGEIGMIKPSGWQTVRYDDLIDGMYLYNRCHLIGYQLAGENANELNLITGTRYLNVEGMLPFENQIADYVNGTQNHVLYQVTPVFDGDNLLTSGVLMEALSVEDKGVSIRFCVYAYNAQPGVEIDYTSGKSEAATTPALEPMDPPEETTAPVGSSYIGNASTRKFHKPECSSVKQMKESNKVELFGTREEIIVLGYESCQRCKP